MKLFCFPWWDMGWQQQCVVDEWTKVLSDDIFNGKQMN